MRYLYILFFTFKTFNWSTDQLKWLVMLVDDRMTMTRNKPYQCVSVCWHETKSYLNGTNLQCTLNTRLATGSDFVFPYFLFSKFFFFFLLLINNDMTDWLTGCMYFNDNFVFVVFISLAWLKFFLLIKFRCLGCVYQFFFVFASLKSKVK